jgi:RHS repeat-associated protein
VTGAEVASYEYDPFGKIIAKSGLLADDFNFRFASYFYDKETGLVYMGMRYYSPEFARFMNRDPIGEKGGLNLYLKK